MVRRAQANGDVYQGVYSGWFCTGCNEFKTDQQLVNGRCPDHPTLEPLWLEENNYFFRLSAYQERLERLYEENPSFCEPEHFRNEVLGWLKDGLRDFSISRSGATWGIPFPGDASHRIYVWFDALTNYVTGAGFPNDRGRDGEVVAGRPSRHRQEHHPLPLPLLAGDADERRAAAPEAGLRPRIHARSRREDEQDHRQRPRSGRDRGDVRRRRRPLHGPARGAVRPRRRRLDRGVRPSLQRGPRERPRQPREPHGQHEPAISRRPPPPGDRCDPGRRPRAPAPRPSGSWPPTTTRWRVTTSTRRWRR